MNETYLFVDKVRSFPRLVWSEGLIQGVQEVVDYPEVRSARIHDLVPLPKRLWELAYDIQTIQRRRVSGSRNANTCSIMKVTNTWSGMIPLTVVAWFCTVWSVPVRTILSLLIGSSD